MQIVKVQIKYISLDGTLISIADGWWRISNKSDQVV